MVDDDLAVTADVPLTVTAGRAHAWRFTLTAGASGLPAGAVVELRVPPTFARPQTATAAGEGYTTVTAGVEAQALDAVGFVEELDDHLSGAEPRLVRSTLPEALGAGERVDIAYGETASGSIGARASWLAPRHMAFAVRVDEEGDGSFREIARFPVDIVAGEPRAIRASTTATASPGEWVRVRAAALDRLGNPASGVEGPVQCAWRRGEAEVGAMELLLDEESNDGDVGQASIEAPLDTGPWWLTCEHPDLPVAVDTVTLVKEPAALALLGGGTPIPRLLWGDLHVHSTLSGDTVDPDTESSASDTPENLYDFARNVAGLDFASISDHDGDDSLASQSDFVTYAIVPTNDKHDEGDFVTLLSWEWTDNTVEEGVEGGHKIVYYLQGTGDAYCESASDTGCGGAGTRSVPQIYRNRSASYDQSCDLWQALDAEMDGSSPAITAFTVPHHVATVGPPQHAVWNTLPDDCSGSPPPGRKLQPLVEIYSDHGSNEGWNGTPDELEDPVECAANSSRTMRAANEYVWGGSEDESNFVGVIASGDSHFGRPGVDPTPHPDPRDGGGGQGFAGMGWACHELSGVDDFRWREVGLAAVWVNAETEADARDRAKVYDSLKRRWTYGTTGVKISLEFRLEDEVDGNPPTLTVVPQGGAILTTGGVLTGNANFPEHDITSPTNHTTTLEIEGICSPAGEALDTVELIHGYGTAGGSFTWEVEDTWDDSDFVDDCLTDSVSLIDAGTVDTTRLSQGKNIYYVKVRTVERKPIVVPSTAKLRVGTTLATAVNCDLTDGSWIPKDPSHPTDPDYSYAARLAADLNACGITGRTFSVDYDDSLSSPVDLEEDRRFTISATGGNFALDLAGDTDVEAAAAAIGFAAEDHYGLSSYTGEDQVQHYNNVEFAWSSPIWIDYSGN